MKIIDYKPGYKAHFERLNKAWLKKYFYVEPTDEYVLSNPEKAILKHGGQILFAENNGKVIGTIALHWLEDDTIELIKMAVEENHQGLGAGTMLFGEAVKRARDLGAEKIVLYSNRKLEQALTIYKKFGFKEVPLEDEGIYERADIKLELAL